MKANVTGLIWEIKTKHDPSALRHYSATFAWFNPDNTSNGGGAGSESGGVCNGLNGKCNTHAYTQAVNALQAGQALCGFRDWRLANFDELNSLSHLGRSRPAIDIRHFPDVDLTANFLGGRIIGTWSASPDASNANTPWVFRFDAGFAGPVLADKSIGLYARLVRSGR
ncbi:MAG: DUF1566 domain-containing protein [Sphingomonadales bacterium]|nr:DUF1566 domain-containing protein [Sphingomonadales bacterium]